MAKVFKDLKLNRQLLDAIQEAGYVETTPIQEKAIPMILGGQDVMGVAQTGTGKTAAYVLPLLMKLKFAQGNTMRAMVIVPTRELAMQVDDNIKNFGKYTDLRTVLLYGGIGSKSQKEALGKGLDILVTTPGRFLDLYLEGCIATKTLQFLVLDEADKMMDMGFIGSLHRILEVIPRKRQNLLFSATMSDLVKKISSDFLAFPQVIEIAPQATVASKVVQQLYEVPNLATKIKLLRHLLDHHPEITRLLIFTKTKVNAENVSKFLQRFYGESEVRVLHANKGQNTRINAMNAFKSGEVKILVATDVAARGIDVSMVSHVINFDVPIVIEDYVHRIGRTGRASQDGIAITFCTMAEIYYLKKIEKLIRQPIQRIEVPQQLIELSTPFDEKQAMAREIDNQKRKENPEFKGAFHDKKLPRKKPNYKKQKSV